MWPVPALVKRFYIQLDSLPNLGNDLVLPANVSEAWLAWAARRCIALGC